MMLRKTERERKREKEPETGNKSRICLVSNESKQQNKYVRMNQIYEKQNNKIQDKRVYFGSFYTAFIMLLRTLIS